MLQSLTTLLFAAMGVTAAGLISALLVEDWMAVRRALGFSETRLLAPVVRRTRIVALHHVPVLRLKPDALRRAA